MKIAIQGIAGSFHDEAAHRFFGKNICLWECDTFAILCEKVYSGEADYGIMAIENTIAGSLLQNYKYLEDFNLWITGEIYLRIKLNLMALKGVKIKDVKQVLSHPIALHQCAEYLVATFPENVVISATDDGAKSAKKIYEEQLTDTAVVAGTEVAKMYNLEILKEGIETNYKNYTRFFALSKNHCPVSDCNKASLSLKVEHRSGSLAEALSIFARHNVNLTKIQSVPILGQPCQYSFHVDVEWVDSGCYEALISEIDGHVLGLSVYGEYKKGELPSEI
jgi:prephenate dehydratase